MTRISTDEPILKQVSVERFREYLIRSGWTPSKHPNERILLFEGSVDDDGSPLQLVLPRSNHLQDANILLAEAINLLAVLTRESPELILHRIMENGIGESKVHRSADTIKFNMFVALLDLSESHVPILERASDREPDDKYTFKGWHKSNEGRFLRYLIRGSLLISLIYFVWHFASGNTGLKWFYAAEAIVLIVIALKTIGLFLRFQPTTIDKPALKAASGSTRMFLRFWVGLWISWVVLYSALATAEFAHWSPLRIPLVNACLNVFNNFSGVFLISMYYEMTERTENPPSSKRRIRFILAIILLLSLFVLELALEEPQKFSFLSGIIVGVSTGLLVTALASRIINLPLWAVVILTLYAVIQLAFPILTHQESWSRDILPLILVVAFLGKVFLLAIVHWARDTNRLLYYMARTRRIHDEENEQGYAQFFDEAISELEKMGDGH